MKNTCLLSEDTKAYLCTYYQILDEMVQAMTTAELTRSISYNFIVQMTPQHQAAVRMCENLLRFTENPALRRFAQGMLREQAQTIARMEQALPGCGQPVNAVADLGLYQRRMELICRRMYARMGRTPECNALDAVFLRQMIPHQWGAVCMAENALKYDVSTALVPILRSIAVRRRQETARMRALLEGVSR